MEQSAGGAREIPQACPRNDAFLRRALAGEGARATTPRELKHRIELLVLSPTLTPTSAPGQAVGFRGAADMEETIAKKQVLRCAQDDNFESDAAVHARSLRPA